MLGCANTRRNIRTVVTVGSSYKIAYSSNNPGKMAGSLETCSKNPSACRGTYLAETETIRTAAAIAKKETGERLRMDGAGNKGRKEVGLARWEDATDRPNGWERESYISNLSMP